jgi:3-dehydroquinate synthetase
VADPEVLGTLPREELRAGLAEVVKHGIIGDPALFELCAGGWPALESDWDQVVRRSMAVKVAVIEDDPYEKGRRALLNLGHTLGHAVEHASGFGLRHGEAVSIGLVAESRLAARLGIAPQGLAQTLAGVLRGLGLPVAPPAGLDRRDILDALQRDKKKRGGRVWFALPRAVGQAELAPVDDLDIVIAALEG